MKKSELVEEVQKALGDETSRAAAERAVDAVLDGIKAGIQNDQEVRLVGFGTFSVAVRQAREGVNPQTKKKMAIPESRTVKFKPGQALKDLA